MLWFPPSAARQRTMRTRRTLGRPAHATAFLMLFVVGLVGLACGLAVGFMIGVDAGVATLRAVGR